MGALDDIFNSMEPSFSPVQPGKKREAVREPVRSFEPLSEVETAAASGHASQPSKVVLVSGATLKPQPVDWLWKHWLARKKLHILAGAPGQGKTTIATSMAATVSVGGCWPDGTRSTAGNVLFWSGEDDPADTLVPRLAASGANLNRCFFITGTHQDGEVVPFDPAHHLGMLREQIETLGGVSLLVVDPVVSAVTGDSHKNTEVRRALQPLVDLAAECACAVLGITHFAKGGQGSDPSQRVVGSVAFTAVARVVLVAAKVSSDDGEDKRVLARSKSNIGPDDGGFEYRLEQVQNADGIHASRIEWGQAVEGSARELLTDPEADDSAEDSGDICELLRASLTADCWTPADEAQRGALAAGFSKKQIWRASKRLGVLRTKGTKGVRDGWYWRLPQDSTLAQDSPKIPKIPCLGNGNLGNLGRESWENDPTAEGQFSELGGTE